MISVFEFLDFTTEMVAENPGREIHVIVRQSEYPLLTQTGSLAQIPSCGAPALTPTYSSWLNQVECWFSILSRAALRGASFTSPRQLRDAIDVFVQSYDQTATPFEWTKAVVHPTGPRRLCFDLCN